MRPTTSWFSDLYGFSDETGSFEEHRARFRMDGEELVCATSPTLGSTLARGKRQALRSCASGAAE